MSPGSSAKASRYELGVLFVHGIGRHEEGDTLLRFGEPLVDVLRKILEKARDSPNVPYARAGVDFAAVGLKDQSDGPASCEVRLRDVGSLRKADGRYPDQQDAQWLFAEAWWDGTFPPPTYADLVKWGVTALPWTLVAHFERRVRRAVYDIQLARSRRGRLAAYAKLIPASVALAVGLLAVPLSLVALSVILLIGLVPAARSVAAFLQRALAVTVGDSYVLLGRPIAAEAIFTKVNRDLAWLSDRCDQVAVVAHSQGAAIAHEVLRRNAELRCDHLITLGSGLKKLAEIQDPGGPEARRLLWASVVALYLAPLLGWAWITQVGTEAAGLLGMLAGSAALAGALFVIQWGDASGRSMSLRKQQRLERRRFLERFKLPESVPRWWDLHSTHDPVPNGPLLDDPSVSVADSLEVPEAHRIWNRASVVTDHTTYWKNPEEFTSRAVLGLLDLSGFDVDRLDPQRSNRWSVANARRGCRVRWLGWARLAWLAGAIGALWTWPTFGAPRSRPVLEALGAWVDRLPGLGLAVYTTGTSELTSTFRYGAVIGVATVLYTLLAAAWSRWDAVDAHAFAEHAPYPRLWDSGAVPFAAVAVLVLMDGLWLVADVPLGQAAAATTGIFLLSLFVTDRYWLPYGDVGSASYRISERERERLVREVEAENAWAANALSWHLVGPEHFEMLEKAAEWGSPDAAYWLAQKYQDEDAPERALDAYDMGIAVGDGLTAWYKGHLLNELERHDEAVVAFERSLALGWGAAAGSLGVTLRQMATEDDDELLDRIERIYERGVNLRDAQSAYFLGGLRASREDTDGAVAAYRVAMSLGHGFSAVQLGNLMERAGEASEALEAYRIGRRMREPYAALAEGDLLERLHDLDGSEAAYRAAIRDDWEVYESSDGQRPRTEARARLGGLYAARGKLGMARKQLELAAEEGSADAAVRLGRLFEEHPEESPTYAGDWAAYFAARQWYDRGIELGSAEAALLRARLEERQYPGGAEREYAVAEQMGSADAALWLADDAFSLYDDDRGRAMLERAVELDSEEGRRWLAELDAGADPRARTAKSSG